MCVCILLCAVRVLARLDALSNRVVDIRTEMATRAARRALPLRQCVALIYAFAVNAFSTY